MRGKSGAVRVCSRVTKKGAGDRWTLLIGAIKLLKGLLLLALGAGALTLLGRDVGEELGRFIETLNVDPQNHLFQTVLGKVAGLDSHKLILGAIGTFFYSALFLTEGIGLLLRKRWAEYFTAIVTGSFVPLEIFELCKHFNTVKFIVTAINVALVVYLIWRLKSGRKSR